MSVVSSTVGIAEDKSSNNNFLESANNPKDELSCDHSAYIIGDGPNCYLYEFILNDPGDLTCVCEGSSGIFSDATWSSDNYIYCIEYGSGLLIVIDVDSCEMWSIGGGGQSLNALAYDPLTQYMYGVGGTGTPGQDYLVKIDPDTGEQEEIGKLGGSIYYTVGISFDSEGILYGWDIATDYLFTIDTETGEATVVGPLGISLNYDCDGDFCKEDDILYIVHNNYLYSFDKDTGECELYDQFPDYVTVTGLAIPYGYDDNTPPVTTHNLNPPEPDGLNGWYVSNVSVTLNATDDFSGVKEIRYTINGGVEQVIHGDNGSFIIDKDGNDILIVYWAIDNWGNEEKPHNWFTVDIDQTEPNVDISYEYHYDKNFGYFFIFTTWATDYMSGMNYVEFYRNNQLMKTVYGPGPEYVWNCEYSNITHFKGIICNREITEEYVKFKAFFIITNESTGISSTIDTYAYDKAGNVGWDEFLGELPPGPMKKLLLFKDLTLPNNYTGYIGRFLIFATFNTN
jgi:hypothetical protein